MASHDRDHVERVVKLAVYIAKREGANVEVVKKSAELHDIARDKPNHAVESAKVAREILKKQGYSDEFIERVAHCIEAHSFSSGVEPKTLEAKEIAFYLQEDTGDFRKRLADRIRSAQVLPLSCPT